MTGFAMHATCPACDGTLTIVTASVPRPQETRTVTECVDCNRRWLIHVACALIDHTRTPAKLAQLTRARSAA